MAAADLLNCWQPYNVRRDTTPHPKVFARDGTPQFGSMELFAERDLKEGEEIVHTYGHTHRNDSAPRPATALQPSRTLTPTLPSPAPLTAPPRSADPFNPHTHRCAVSLLVYGFVQHLDPPLLCSIDLPSYREESPWDNTPEEDDTYYDVRSGKRALYSSELSSCGRFHALLCAARRVAQRG